MMDSVNNIKQEAFTFDLELSLTDSAFKVRFSSTAGANDYFKGGMTPPVRHWVGEHLGE